jgi:hypothetical protein
MKIVTIFGYSIASMIIASAIFGFIIEGFYGLLGGPFLMLFGWFYFPIVFILEAIAFYVWRRFVGVRYGRACFILIGVVTSGILFSLIGIKEEGSELRYTIAYVIAASASALITCLSISSKNRTIPG